MKELRTLQAENTQDAPPTSLTFRPASCSTTLLLKEPYLITRPAPPNPLAIPTNQLLAEYQCRNGPGGWPGDR